MSTSVMQFRVDDGLKNQASAVCEKLGLDLPTALRMFMKRTVLVNGIPFEMTLPKEESQSKAIQAMHVQSEAAKTNGTSDITLDEINDEINAYRAELKAKRQGGKRK